MLISLIDFKFGIPRLIAIAKGKIAMVEFLTLIQESSPRKNAASGSSQLEPHSLRKIQPQRCHGGVSLHNVTFTYPTLSEPTLREISLFLPANDMTFIVGSSGSGKSTIAALLMNMYTPDVGSIYLGETDIRYLDERWLRSSICGVGQGWSDVILDGAFITDNRRQCALGLEGVNEKEVEDTCKVVPLHDFIRDLPDGYTPALGGGVDVALSGGQRHRLAIARARLRNPPVLVLGPTSRLLVFEAIKTWRHNKTTVVITHDFSQVESDDFVYVMKNGRLVEQGCNWMLEAIADLTAPAPVYTTTYR